MGWAQGWLGCRARELSECRIAGLGGSIKSVLIALISLVLSPASSPGWVMTMQGVDAQPGSFHLAGTAPAASGWLLLSAWSCRATWMEESAGCARSQEKTDLWHTDGAGREACPHGSDRLGHAGDGSDNRDCNDTEKKSSHCSPFCALAAG